MTNIKKDAQAHAIELIEQLHEQGVLYKIRFGDSNLYGERTRLGVGNFYAASSAIAQIGDTSGFCWMNSAVANPEQELQRIIDRYNKRNESVAHLKLVQEEANGELQ